MGKGLINHGQERKQIISADGGKLTFTKREKFCVFHGWIDLFAIGGDLAWHRQHGRCDRELSSGAEFEPAKALKMAA